MSITELANTLSLNKKYVLGKRVPKLSRNTLYLRPPLYSILLVSISKHGRLDMKGYKNGTSFTVGLTVL